VRYQAGREPGIGPAPLTCPNTDTDHSDQSVPVLFAPLFLEGRHPPALRCAADSFGASRPVRGTGFPYETGAVVERAVSYITTSGLAPAIPTACSW
jgi:hypothetical protein